MQKEVIETLIPDGIQNVKLLLYNYRHAIVLTIDTACVYLTELNPGLVGLALAYSVSLAGRLQYCVRLSAEIENLVRNIPNVHVVQ